MKVFRYRYSRIAAVFLIAVFSGVFAGTVGADTVRFVHDRSVEWKLPDDPFVRGQYYFNHGDRADGTYDLARAERYYLEAVRADPRGNELAWYQLGRVMFIQGRLPEAVSYFKTQQEYFGEKIPNVHYMLGLTYGFLGKETGIPMYWYLGEEHFLKFIAYKPQSPWAHVDLAWIYFSQGKYDDMLATVRAVLPLHEQNPWIQNMYGLALMNTGKYDDAYTAFSKAEDLATDVSLEEWGRSYPGNDPALWGAGYESFVESISKNKALAYAKTHHVDN